MPSGATCGAELDHRRRELRALVSHAELRIRHVALVAVRIAEMLADLGDVIELVARHVVAEPVARVLGEPESPVRGSTSPPTLLRMPSATSSAVPVFGIDAAILRDAGRRQADVARRAEGHVEPASCRGPDISSRAARRAACRRRRPCRAALVEVGFGIVVFVELVDVDDVERAVLEGDAGRHAQPLDERSSRPSCRPRR